MELDLTPKKAEVMSEVDGGSYYTWSSSKVPVLAKYNVGAGCLVLQPHGFALPHYADSSKIAFVIQGSDGIVGMVLPNTEKEVVVKLKKGDLLPSPIGAISWWFNNGDSEELIIVFLGETSQSHVPGQFSYFMITGSIGLIGAFSTNVTTKSYNLTQNEAKMLTKSQQESLIIKLQKDQTQTMPTPQKDKTKDMVYNIDAAKPDLEVKNGGLVKTLSEGDFPFVGQVGLSVMKVRLEANAIKAPMYLANPAIQVMYVARGSGKIEIVGLDGKLVLDSKVEAGDLVVVPKFFVVAHIAGEDGMECYSILTTKRPAIEEFGGRSSVWGAISPAVQEMALNVDPKFLKLFLSKINNTTNIIPPN